MYAPVLAAAAVGWLLGRGGFGGEGAGEAGLDPQAPEAGVRGALAGVAPGLGGMDPHSPAGRWMVRALAAGEVDFPALLEAVDGLFPDDPGPDGKKLAAVRWLLGLWTMKDPDAALAFVRNRNDDKLSSAFGDTLARVNPARALAFCQEIEKNRHVSPEIGTGKMDKLLSYVAAKRLAVVDPEGFLRLDTAFWSNAHVTAAAFASLAKQDPEKAKELWVALQETEDFQEKGKKESLYLLMDSLVSSDAGAARAWMESLSDPKTKQLAAHAWLTALARKVPRAALREMGGMGEFGFGGRYPDTAALAAGLPASQGDGRMMVFLSLAKLDRGEALAAWREWNAANPGELPEQNALTGMMQVSRGQMVRYPDDPSEFLGALRDSTAGMPGESAGAALQAAYLEEQLRDRSPEFVLELAKLRAAEHSERDSGESDQTLVSMLNYAAKKDSESVLKIMDQMPARERGEVADGMLERASLDDLDLRNQIVPLVSAHFWKRQVDSYSGGLSESPTKLREMAPAFAGLTGEAAAPGITYFSQMWAQSDPAQAVNWALTLPPETQLAAVGGAVQSWVKWDDAAASAWADALPAGPVRDAAAVGLAKSLAGVDLPSAMAWAANVSDPQAATELLRQLGYKNGSKDNAEFFQLLPGSMAQLGLSAEQRERVAAAIKKGQEPMDHSDPFAVRKPLD